MVIDLSGKVAVVSGSTEGIGFAAAAGLAAAGATVVLNGREPGSVEAAIGRLRDLVPNATVSGVAADLGSATGCDLFVAAVPHADILVNNLGIFEVKDFFATSDADWSRFFETNVLSGVRLSRAYLPAMMTEDWGRVVFVSSESALNIPPDMLNYAVTKTAMLSISRGLAKLAKGTGVTVNAVLPGPTMTTGVAAMLDAQAEAEGKTVEEVGRHFVAEKRPSSIIQRLASAEEVADMIVYLCSPQASVTTGAALRVDGGLVDTIA